MKKLRAYEKKRDFTRTREPAPPARASRHASTFVIQKHDASRLHYDLRFAVDGVLKSWAVPKGMPLRKGEKRLAIQVEDHPLAYRNFEGTIPKGEYGGGTVMLWDRGRVKFDGKSAQTGLRHGHVDFELRGKKLNGAWMLIRLKNEETQWLLIKRESDHPAIGRMEDVSAKSGKSMRDISGEKAASSRRKKSPPAKSKRSTGKGTPAKAIFTPPMLARPAKELPRERAWSYEVKFDGYRAVAQVDARGASLWSRNHNRLAKFVEIEEALSSVRLQPTVLDGEIVALEPGGRSSFQRLQRFEEGSERPPLFYYVFDLMMAGGKDVRGKSLTARRKLLARALAKAPDSIRLSQPLRGAVDAIVAASRRHGFEGIIAKRSDSTYESGKRTGAWKKVRFSLEQEFVIGGFTAPEGARSHFGALLLGYHHGRKLRFAGKVGTGFDTKTLGVMHGTLVRAKRARSPFADPVDEPRVTWVKPAFVAQIKFSEWTRDGRLRQPVFLGLRKDKRPAGVVRET